MTAGHLTALTSFNFLSLGYSFTAFSFLLRTYPRLLLWDLRRLFHSDERIAHQTPLIGPQPPFLPVESTAQFSSTLSLLSSQKHTLFRGSSPERPYQKLFTLSLPIESAAVPPGRTTTIIDQTFATALFSRWILSTACDGHVDVTFPVALSEFREHETKGCAVRSLFSFLFLSFASPNASLSSF